MSTGYSAPTPPSPKSLRQIQGDLSEFGRYTNNLSTIEYIVSDRQTFSEQLDAYYEAVSAAVAARGIAWDGDYYTPLIFDHTEAKNFNPATARGADTRFRAAYEEMAQALLATHQAEGFYYSSVTREMESPIALAAMIRVAKEMKASLGVSIDPIRDTGLTATPSGQKFLATLPPEITQGEGMSGAGGSL